MISPGEPTPPECSVPVFAAPPNRRSADPELVASIVEGKSTRNEPPASVPKPRCARVAARRSDGSRTCGFAQSPRARLLDSSGHYTEGRLQSSFCPHPLRLTLLYPPTYTNCPTLHAAPNRAEECVRGACGEPGLVVPHSHHRFSVETRDVDAGIVRPVWGGHPRSHPARLRPETRVFPPVGPSRAACPDATLKRCCLRLSPPCPANSTRA